MTHLDRRQFNLLVGSGLAAGAGSALWPRRAKADAAKTITVLNWQGYGTDEAWALKEFGAATGIEVKHDYFNSEPEMLTKLRTNPGAYDVVLINSARTRQAQGESLIDPIDFAKVPNSKDLAPALRDHANINIDGKPYGVSWVWGINGLAVRRGGCDAQGRGEVVSHLQGTQDLGQRLLAGASPASALFARHRRQFDGARQIGAGHRRAVGGLPHQ